MPEYVLTETIHHGDFHNVRTLQFETLSNDELTVFMANSPYPVALNDEKAGIINETLASAGGVAVGWASLTVAEVPAPTSRSYVIGLPVVVTVHDDGRVEFEVDKSEAYDAPFEDQSNDLPEEVLIEDRIRISDFVAAEYALLNATHENPAGEFFRSRA